MDYNEIFKRTFKIISSPNTTWQEIALNENIKVKEDFKYFYTLLGIGMLATLIGSFVYTTENRIITSILRSIISGISIYSGFWANYYILTEILNKRFNVFNKRRQNIRLLIYSMSLSILINALISIFPGLFFLKIINIYTLFMVWEGVGIMSSINENHKTNFVLFLSIAIILIPIIFFQLLLYAIPAAN